MKLYEIASEYDKLLDFDLESEDDVEAFKALMSEVKADFDVKAENICKLIRNIESDAEACKAEKMKLEKKQKVAENKAEALREYLAFNAKHILQQGEKRKIGIFTLGFRKCQPKLIVDTVEYVPDRFFKPVLDVAMLKAEVKDGKSYTGVRLEAGESFVIN